MPPPHYESDNQNINWTTRHRDTSLEMIFTWKLYAKCICSIFPPSFTYLKWRYSYNTLSLLYYLPRKVKWMVFLLWNDTQSSSALFICNAKLGKAWPLRVAIQQLAVNNSIFAPPSYSIYIIGRSPNMCSINSWTCICILMNIMITEAVGSSWCTKTYCLHVDLISRFDILCIPLWCPTDMHSP